MNVSDPGSRSSSLGDACNLLGCRSDARAVEAVIHHASNHLWVFDRVRDHWVAQHGATLGGLHETLLAVVVRSVERLLRHEALLSQELVFNKTEGLLRTDF